MVDHRLLATPALADQNIGSRPLLQHESEVFSGHQWGKAFRQSRRAEDIADRGRGAMNGPGIIDQHRIFPAIVDRDGGTMRVSRVGRNLLESGFDPGPHAFVQSPDRS